MLPAFFVPLKLLYLDILIYFTNHPFTVCNLMFLVFSKGCAIIFKTHVFGAEIAQLGER
jgi:hypothetical protein